MLESGLFAMLVADPTVAGSIATRLYPMILPDDVTLPAATYQRISTVTDQTLTSIVSLTTVRMQFDTWASSYTVAKQIADALNSVLEGFYGSLPNGVQIANITLDSQIDLYDSPTTYYRVSSDYLIQFQR